MNKKTINKTLFAIFAIILCILPTVNAQVYLEGYWALNEGTGIVAVDSSSFERDGAIVGAVYVADVFGLSGFGLSFDGDDYLEMNNPTLIGNRSFTMSLWLNSADVTSIVPVYDARIWSPSEAGVCYYFEGGLLKCRFDAVGYAFDYSFSADVSYYLTVSYNGDNSFLYINGVLIDSIDITVFAGLQNDKLDFGKTTDNGVYYSGVLDEIRYYSRALTESEILTLYTFYTATPTVAPTSDIVTTNNAHYGFIFILVLAIVSILLTLYNRVPLLNFVVGALTFAMAVLTLGSSSYPFQPYFSLLFMILAGLCALSGGVGLRRGGD